MYVLICDMHSLASSFAINIMNCSFKIKSCVQITLHKEKLSILTYTILCLFVLFNLKISKKYTFYQIEIFYLLNVIDNYDSCIECYYFK